MKIGAINNQSFTGLFGRREVRYKERPGGADELVIAEHYYPFKNETREKTKEAIRNNSKIPTNKIDWNFLLGKVPGKDMRLKTPVIKKEVVVEDSLNFSENQYLVYMTNKSKNTNSNIAEFQEDENNKKITYTITKLSQESIVGECKKLDGITISC